MGESYEFDVVDFITAGAVGQPGQRTFYLQAEDADRRVSLIAEKTQVSALADLAQELLAQIGVTVTPDDLDEAGQRLREPLQPAWRAGSVRLGMDENAQRFVIEVEELLAQDDTAEPAFARFWMTREQLAAFTAHAAYTVEAGARPTCRLCGRPIDVEGHACPSMNGHGPLSV